MADKIVHGLMTFLRKNLKANASFLLGLSGGTDSLALFYLLLECRRQISFTFAIAHVDHGWRKESAQEAAILEGLAKKHSVPFHMTKLTKEQKAVNLEARCREKRFAFFDATCREYGYQAVMLAHQLDEQAETVLKNVLEGAQLPCCNGISAVKRIRALEIWRPLLGVSKSALSQWLQARQLAPFVDPSNFDDAFLRARMRKEIVPNLERSFGKGIKQTLAFLGSESQELRAFLIKHLSPILETVRISDWGAFLDLSINSFAIGKASLFEIKFIIRHVCQMERCFPSREIVNSAALQLKKNAANKRYIMGPHCIYIDRKRLFVVNIPSKPQCIAKKVNLGDWKIQVEPAPPNRGLDATDWKDIWAGRGKVVLPQKEEAYQIAFPKRDVSLAKWWSKKKIPSLFWWTTPVIVSGDTMVHEFLTGSRISHGEKGGGRHAGQQQITLLRCAMPKQKIKL